MLIRFSFSITNDACLCMVEFVDVNWGFLLFCLCAVASCYGSFSVEIQTKGFFFLLFYLMRCMSWMLLLISIAFHFDDMLVELMRLKD